MYNAKKEDKIITMMAGKFKKANNLVDSEKSYFACLTDFQYSLSFGKQISLL